MASEPIASWTKHRDWRSLVAPYERKSDWRAAIQVAITLLPLFGLFALMYLAMDVSYWLTLALAVPAAGLLVRTFIIMHDCAHGSFFSSRGINGAVGWFTGVLTMTPFAQWRRDHAIHHASSGDLDRRGHGDVDTLTVREFRKLPAAARWKYRLYRHPLVLFGLGPIHMMTTSRMRKRGAKLNDAETRSVWSTNAGIAAVFVAAALIVGWRAALLIYLPSIYIAAAVGIWLFYVQHQFEETYWKPHPDWDYLDASIRGSSYLKLPRVLRWFTGDIGVHHVHHLSPRIPNYRLQQCHDANPLFHEVTTLTIGDAFRMLRLALWDEDRQQLVPFSDVRLTVG